MTEIRVEKKKSPTWLWWVLGLIVAVLIVWAIVEAMDDDDPTVDEPVVMQPAPAASPQPVAQAALLAQVVPNAPSPPPARPSA